MVVRVFWVRVEDVTCAERFFFASISMMILFLEICS